MGLIARFSGGSLLLGSLHAYLDVGLLDRGLLGTFSLISFKPKLGALLGSSLPLDLDYATIALRC